MPNSRPCDDPTQALVKELPKAWKHMEGIAYRWPKLQAERVPGVEGHAVLRGPRFKPLVSAGALD